MRAALSVHRVHRGYVMMQMRSYMSASPVPTGDDKPKAPLATRIWKRVKEEAHHYWAGTKLLGSNMRVEIFSFFFFFFVLGA